MQTIGGHIPFGFFQGTDVLVHWEVEVTGLVEVVVFHFLCVEVDIGSVVGRRKSNVCRVGRIQQELSRIGHEGSGIQGEMVGVEFRQTKTHLTVSRITVGRQHRLA